MIPPPVLENIFSENVDSSLMKDDDDSSDSDDDNEKKKVVAVQRSLGKNTLEKIETKVFACVEESLVPRANLFDLDVVAAAAAATAAAAAEKSPLRVSAAGDGDDSTKVYKIL